MYTEGGVIPILRIRCETYSSLDNLLELQIYTPYAVLIDSSPYKDHRMLTVIFSYRVVSETGEI